MTNFERIKAMSVEELAKEFDCNRCIYCDINDDCVITDSGCFVGDDDCVKGRIAYLNAESEEE